MLSKMRDVMDAGKSINQGAANYLSKDAVTIDEFQSLANDSDARYEYIDGHVYALASPTLTHQIIHSKLYKILTLIFDKKKYRVFSAPFDVTLKDELSGSLNVLQPDLLVSCDYNDKRTKSDRYEGIPALVIEIMSMQTRAKDMVEKLNIYMTGGVIEYWIIDPRDKRVIVYLFKERQPEDISVFTAKDIVASYTFPEIHIKAGDIFSDI